MTSSATPRPGAQIRMLPTMTYGRVAAMDAVIREYRPADEEAVAALSIRAWAPVFGSLEQVLGPEMSARLHGNWQQFQESAVRGVLADAAMHVWVAAAEQAVIGFVAVTLHHERLLGEITMLAVDPAHQDQGAATMLTAFATDWLRRCGMRVAMVETGGDQGHAAARHVYEKAGYTLLPVARYFKSL